MSPPANPGGLAKGRRLRNRNAGSDSTFSVPPDNPCCQASCSTPAVRLVPNVSPLVSQKKTIDGRSRRAPHQAVFGAERICIPVLLRRPSSGHGVCFFG